MRNQHTSHYHCLALLVGAFLFACSSPTYVLVTVEADPSISQAITELRFDSLLNVDGAGGSSDSRRIDKGGAPLPLPDIYTILAEGWGDNGETVTIVVEGYNAAGDAIARGRAEATLISGKESSLRIVLTQPCKDVAACLGGQAFCDNPFTCNCEGDSCNQGFCEAIAKDDGNSCTEFSCDEPTQTASVTPINDGNSCGADPIGTAQFCGQGLCKVPACGDFVIDVVTGEECDDGPDNSDDDFVAGDNSIQCRTTCRLPSCGDGFLDQGEECDDGALNVDVDDSESMGTTDAGKCRGSVTLEDGNGALLSCITPRCGDGVIDEGERCDDHDSLNGDGCNPTCSLFGEVGIFAGKSGGPGHRDGSSDNRINSPASFSSANDGYTYFAASTEHTIRRIRTVDGLVETIAGKAGVSGNADGVGGMARFTNPTDIYVSGNNLFLIDSGNHQIKQIDLSSYLVTTIAGTGLLGQQDGEAGGALTQASLLAPSRLVVKTSDEVLFMDSQRFDGCVLRMVTLSTQTVSTLLGQGTQNTSLACGVAFDGGPFGPTFTDKISDMTMYNGDLVLSEGDTIRKVSFTPLSVETYSGLGLIQPEGLSVVGDILYIADAIDADTGAIRIVDLNAPTSSTLLVSAPTLRPLRTVSVSGSTILVSESPGTGLLPVDVIYSGNVGSSPIAWSVLAGSASQAGQDDGSVAVALFNEPTVIAIGREFSDSVYVYDRTGSTLREVGITSSEPNMPVAVTATETPSIPGTPANIDIVAISVLANRVLALFESDLYNLFPTQSVVFQVPSLLSGMTIHDGNAYLVAPMEREIYQLNLDAAVLTTSILTGSQSQEVRASDGSFRQAAFVFPVGLVSCGGELYLIESEENDTAVGVRASGHLIRRLDLANEQVSTLAGAATDNNHVDGPGLLARFDKPEAIACDERNSEYIILYVADQGSHTIRQIVVDRVTKEATVTTLAGTPYNSGSIDGTGDQAGFNTPQGLAFDPISGDLFVTDRAENVVRRIR